MHGKFICDCIIAEVKESHYFSISADEVTDVSSWEQLGIVLRYVKDGQATEELVGFVACNEVCGSDIFKAIKKFIRDCGLDINMCRGQGYDGAGAMAGALNGCQALLQAEEAMFYHCSSHQLNLALSKACTVPEIHQMVSSLKALGIFFKYSPKRQRKLEACVDKVNEDQKRLEKAEIPRCKFKLLCETRWVERHTALEDFNYLYEPIINCLEQMCYPLIDEDKQWAWDTKTKTEAAGLLNNI